MSFGTAITRHPIPFDRGLGADALGQLPDLAPELRPLIEGTAGCSPYLALLISKEAGWLAEALTVIPTDVQAQLLQETAALEMADLGSGLRLLKRRVHLFAALADLGGVWSLEDVTGAISDFADHAVAVCLRHFIGTEARRGKIPGITEEDAETGAGMVAIAMGKMGAHELNYSSDIDLICLFDDDRFDGADEMEARAGFIRVTRKMAAMLNDVTRDGYVFRTDLRLRPDASVTPVCISMTAAERYYEAEGRNWERAAYIKARAAAGDIAAGEKFLDVLTPFVWRRHLDFAAIEDTQNMRRKIRKHKGLHGPIRLEGQDMKLGPGGIREIEFFAQTRQIVSGGRDPDLRLRGTVPALAMLAEKGWIKPDTAKALTDHYRAHREIEHRVQMIHDTQTHDLPMNDEGFLRLANLCGETDVSSFRRALKDRLAAVDALCEPFFKTETAPAHPMPDLSATAEDIVARWPGYPALRSPRGQAIFARLKPDILARFLDTPRPDEALTNFDGFLRGLPAGVQLFALFEANPSLVDLLVDICGTAPGLSRHLSRNSGVLDAVIGGGFFEAWPGEAALEADLESDLEGLDYEEVLNTTRRWKKEWHFRIGVHHLRGLIAAEEAGAQYSQLASTITRALWPRVCDEVARRHGPGPGQGGVVAMGSLGAGQLTAGSDLDLIVIYDAENDAMSDGKRPLDARGWYAKATKTLITALSAPTGDGTLYEVDMRLRPSGRQGPVATSVESYRNYHLTEAWTWEHLALTRARPLAGNPELLEMIEDVRIEVLNAPRKHAEVVKDAQDMRERLAAAGRVGDGLDAKEGPGRMKDIELVAQAAALMAHSDRRNVAAQLEAGVALGWLRQDEATELDEAHHLHARLNQATRLLTDKRLDLEEIGLGGRRFLSRETDVADVGELAAKTEAVRAAAEAIIARAMSNPPKEP